MPAYTDDVLKKGVYTYKGKRYVGDPLKGGVPIEEYVNPVTGRGAFAVSRSSTSGSHGSSGGSASGGSTIQTAVKIQPVDARTGKRTGSPGYYYLEERYLPGRGTSRIVRRLHPEGYHEVRNRLDEEYNRRVAARLERERFSREQGVVNRMLRTPGPSTPLREEKRVSGTVMPYKPGFLTKYDVWASGIRDPALRGVMLTIGGALSTLAGDVRGAYQAVRHPVSTAKSVFSSARELYSRVRREGVTSILFDAGRGFGMALKTEPERTMGGILARTVEAPVVVRTIGMGVSRVRRLGKTYVPLESISDPSYARAFEAGKASYYTRKVSPDTIRKTIREFNENPRLARVTGLVEREKRGVVSVRQPPAGGFHATSGRVPRGVVERGSSEFPGLYIAPGSNLAFLRLAREQGFNPFDMSVIPRLQRPALLAVSVERVRLPPRGVWQSGGRRAGESWEMASRRDPGVRWFLEHAKPGEAVITPKFLGGIGMYREPEAVVTPGTRLYLVRDSRGVRGLWNRLTGGYEYYTRVAGRDVPIYHVSARSGAGRALTSRDTRVLLARSSGLYEYARSGPRGSLAGSAARGLYSFSSAFAYQPRAYSFGSYTRGSSARGSHIRVKSSGSGVRGKRGVVTSITREYSRGSSSFTLSRSYKIVSPLLKASYSAPPVSRRWMAGGFRFKSYEEERAGKGGFLVLVRERGVWRRATKRAFRSRESAWSFGAGMVEHTPMASLKVVRSRREHERLFGSGSTGLTRVFRRSKREPGVFVEKSRYRISTPGEIKGITLKGLRSKKRGRVMGGWL